MCCAALPTLAMMGAVHGGGAVRNADGLHCPATSVTNKRFCIPVIKAAAFVEVCPRSYHIKSFGFIALGNASRVVNTVSNSYFFRVRAARVRLHPFKVCRVNLLAAECEWIFRCVHFQVFCTTSAWTGLWRTVQRTRYRQITGAPGPACGRCKNAITKAAEFKSMYVWSDNIRLTMVISMYLRNSTMFSTMSS